MTFFGPMGSGGPLGGGPPGKPHAGLPFAGIPPELQDAVDELLASEPDHGEPDVVFSHRAVDDELRQLTMWSLLRRHPGMLAAAGGLVVITAGLLQAGPQLTAVAIDRGMFHRDFAVVAIMASIYLGTIVIGSYSQRAMVQVTGRLAAWVMNDLRVKVFAHLQRLSLDFYTDEKAGVIMTRMTSDIENMQQLLQDGLGQFALQGLTMAVITVILFVDNPILALITVALVVPLLTAASVWFKNASERAYLAVRDGIAEVLAHLSESLHGIRIVVAHNRQAHNVVEHRNVVGDYRRANYMTARINALYGPGTQLQSVLTQLAVLAIGGAMAKHHEVSVGVLVGFFIYLNRFFQPIPQLVQQYNTYQQAQSSITKLRSLLCTEPSVPEAPDAIELPPIQGEIVLERVWFSYPNNPEGAFAPSATGAIGDRTLGRTVLSDVSLRIAPGETVALVGPTGSGKSTVAKLVTRFYDPVEGSVLIDDYDLRKVTLASLRRQLGVVPQEPFLFAGTIRDNIAFARPEASDEEVQKAIDRVGLRFLIDRLPEGIDTVVHERGQSLSSGERQLIALARAFMAHPRVLVLDEATSNLDLASESRVEAALDVLLEGRSAILVAHRLSTAMRADRIVVVDGGRIVESGTHEELVARGGLYATMHETWMTSVLAGDEPAPAA